MNLVVDQVVQLQHVHVANGNRLGVRFTGTAIEQGGLAVGADQTVAVAVRQRGGQQALQDLRLDTVEHRGGNRGVRLGLLGTGRNQLLPLGFQIRIQRDVPTGVSNPAKV